MPLQITLRVIQAAPQPYNLLGYYFETLLDFCLSNISQKLFILLILFNIYLCFIYLFKCVFSAPYMTR